jgi:hypothetical protein
MQERFGDPPAWKITFLRKAILMRKRTPCDLTLSLLDGRICPKCNEWVPFPSGFSRDRTAKIDGYSRNCKQCHKRWASKPKPKDPQMAAEQRALRAHNMAIIRAHSTKIATVRSRIRQMRKKLCGGTHTREQFIALCGDYNWQCLRCKCYTSRLQADHVLPVTSGGTSDISNIQPLCKQCNLWKRMKHIDFRPNPL